MLCSGGMRKFLALLLTSTAFTLSACGEMGQQWVDPDTTFSKLGQPEVKGVNDTQEEMAKQAVGNEDFLRAAQFYQQLVSSDKGTAEQKLRYKMGLADSVRRLGQVQSALAMYDELNAQNPDNIEISEGRGLTLMSAGKVVDAGRVFSTIIEKDPTRWRSLNALGLLFVTKNMIPEAMAYFEEALNQSPNNPAVLNNIGLASAINHDYPKAVESLGYASRLSKANAQRRQVDLNLAMVYGVSGNMEQARETASKYLEGAALDNNMGLYAHLAKDDALAKSYLNMALSQSPTYYQRAWENLDSVADSAHTSDDQKRSSKAQTVHVKEKPAPEHAKVEKPAVSVAKREVQDVKQPKPEVVAQAVSDTPKEKTTPDAAPPTAETKQSADAKGEDKKPEQSADTQAPEAKSKADKAPADDKVDSKPTVPESSSLWSKVADVSSEAPAADQHDAAKEKKPSTDASKDKTNGVTKDTAKTKKSDAASKEKSASKAKNKNKKAMSKKAKAAAKKKAAAKHKAAVKKPAITPVKEVAKPVATPVHPEPAAAAPAEKEPSSTPHEKELPPLPELKPDPETKPVTGSED